jgi:hypothetical protein
MRGVSPMNQQCSWCVVCYVQRYFLKVFHKYITDDGRRCVSLLLTLSLLIEFILKLNFLNRRVANSIKSSPSKGALSDISLIAMMVLRKTVRRLLLSQRPFVFPCCKVSVHIPVTAEFSQQWLWRILSSRMYHRVTCKNRRFGGAYLLHHQGEKNQRARN